MTDTVAPGTSAKRTVRKQNFRGEIGHVAGRDIKANNSLSNVSLHFHNAQYMQCISNRQRNAIARRALKIQIQTGTDKLIVYQRLMMVFDFHNMAEMPSAIYKRVIAYLDAWLKNGWTDDMAGTAPWRLKSSHDWQVDRTKAASELTTISAPAHASQLGLSADRQTTSAVTPTPSGRPMPWHKLAVVSAMTAALVVSVCVVVWGSMVPGREPFTSVSMQCEYGGYRYSLGSIVPQAGTLLRCVEVGLHSVKWHAMPDNELPKNEAL
ncbi:hypothetical protein [Burkholderia ubonensis]|uniref:hypothetical protein n=1 Tax=Burkholderia ubonensis TaxID=101571 RepID=UPI000AFE75E5|nr:hypothetical protein [Burkholderia ubonensis]